MSIFTDPNAPDPEGPGKEAPLRRASYDRDNVELFGAGHKHLIRTNLNNRAQTVFDQFNKVSDCSISDIILALAKYGGRVEVQGLGTFFVREMRGKWKGIKGVKPADYDHSKPDPRRKWQAARIWVDFKMDWRLRDLLNEDWFDQDPDVSNVPRRNKTIFVEKRNLLL